MIQSPDCSLSPESDLIPLGLHSMEIGSTHSEVRKYIFIGPWSIYSGSGLNMYVLTREIIISQSIVIISP